jgi:hypothetical protein
MKDAKEIGDRKGGRGYDDSPVFGRRKRVAT